MNEWLRIMLEEIRRKNEERRQERQEHLRRVGNHGYDDARGLGDIRQARNVSQSQRGVGNRFREYQARPIRHRVRDGIHVGDIDKSRRDPCLPREQVVQQRAGPVTAQSVAHSEHRHSTDCLRPPMP